MKNLLATAAVFLLLLTNCSEKEQNEMNPPQKYGNPAREMQDNAESDSADADELRTPSGMPAQSEPDVDIDNND